MNQAAKASSASLTAQLADRIAASDPLASADAVAASLTGLLDFLACAIAGSEDPALAILLDTLPPAPGDAVLIGHGRRTDGFTAALANGHAGHALDFDDVHASVRGHPSTVILPALLAAVPDSDADAGAFLAAYIVGVETMARLGLALGSRHYEIGFHATATLGTIGSAAAVARRRRLDACRVAVALGLAATQSAGLRLQFGSDAKPLHAGLAARVGLTAARLAERGFGGAADFLDGPVGFFSCFAAGAERPERVLDGWGEPWQIVRPGLILKEFAFCTAAHCAAEAILGLIADHDIDPRRIEGVTATFPPGGDAALVVRAAEDGIAGRFSVEYVIATALLRRDLGLANFSAVPVPDDVRTLAALVERRHDETAPRMSNDPSTRFTEVTIRFNDGRTLSRRVGRIRGVQDPAAKFADATGGVAHLAEIPALVTQMESRSDLLGLLDSLGRERRPQ
ncbi:protein involved in propionate catabolism [Azospirillum sp. TSH100]|uniref:MmgE/PrpD family protein n=1 Tax=Azospirillum sp. TSH100 TaxID=652764 RepID=UPI000D6191F5|nr:MmgE/PrpD family protein [Azospirillum sp. TSH100]PWC89318.1 protein involved in propionate catabolism [Azospirillum sp. TSH100]QCG89689.1 MmgE/PrpD family protein [Azospirillum sp. TSH100]